MSDLFQTLIEHQKPYYTIRFYQRLRDWIETSVDPLKSRRQFAYAIDQHFDQPSFTCLTDSTKSLVQSIEYAVNHGDIDLTCLELCYNACRKQYRDIPMHAVLYNRE